MQSGTSTGADTVPPGGMGRVGVFSPGIARIPHLATLLGAERIVFRPWRAGQVDTVVGWGCKPNTERPRQWAEWAGCRYVRLEDGFLRSVGLGVSGDPPLSMVVDDVGIYYDATRPSRLEQMLEAPSEPDPLADPELRTRARRGMERIRAHRLSKYNAAPVHELSPTHRRRVLVVDQTAGDGSVRLGMPHRDGFRGMLEAARREHPDAEIVIKTHPDVADGKKRGHLGGVQPEPGVRVLREPVNPVALLEQVDAVYVVSSLMGFEALLLGKPVTCFGAPFYAGWRLTDDRVEIPRRSKTRTLEEIFAAAYLLYTRYVDPETGQRCHLERIIEHLALQRQMGEANVGQLVCIGFSAWKRGFIPEFLRSPNNQVCFSRNAAAAERRGLRSDAKLIVWGAREPDEVRALAKRQNVPVWRMEDGFLRSVGLGSDLYRPASLVLDRLGVYYDPTRPSDLEQILQDTVFSREELDRAAVLRRDIVNRKLSKYNVGGGDSVGPPAADERKVVLVVGQVEDDLSITLGCPGIRSNEELLRVARERNPEAYIIFKPHPEVISGNRQGMVPRRRANVLADEIAEDAAAPACLAAVDEVHTLTSLVGFEGLLRDLRVVTYGQPFYAGWGLTEDDHPVPRRTRRLALDELVAGTLLRYPRYVSRRTGAFTTPEMVLRQLDEERSLQKGLTPIRSSWAARQARKGVNLLRGMLYAS